MTEIQSHFRKRHLGNVDVTDEENPVNGKVWRWEAGEVMEAPQRASASGVQYYMVLYGQR